MAAEADNTSLDLQDRYRVLAERLPQLVWTALPDGYHDWFNQRCQEYTGLNSQDLILHWKRCIHPDDVDRAREAWNGALKDGVAYEVEYRIKGADGIYRRFLVRALPMHDKAGQIIRWFGTCTDLSTISDQSPERSGQSEKLEAMGQLTGSVVHDFNNLLTVVLGNLELIGMRSQDETILRYTNSAIEATRRGVSLTSQLLAFSRAQSFEITPVNVNDIISGMDDLLQRSLGPEIRVTLDLASNIPSALGNTNQLELAILNLAINARDAMNGKGNLIISTRIDASSHSAASSQPSVVITVSDTGKGMSPEIMARAFEPFFTTKSAGKGTGLGLAQVQTIARQSGGSVGIESTPGHGTSVSIHLPVTADYSVADDRAPVIAVPLKGSSEIVLVIDEDPQIRRYILESLNTLAYIVFEAADCKTGLRLLEDLCPDILILDHAMLGNDGISMIGEIGHKWPDMPVILTNGAGFTGIPDLPQHISVLSKPFRISELSRSIAQALASRLASGTDTPYSDWRDIHAAG